MCLETPTCCQTFSKKNQYCYRAQCYATARGLAERLRLQEDHYFVSFQSRLGKDPWTQPYTEQTIRDWAHQGIRRILVFAPAFTADCLETIYEIGEEYLEIFQEEGGEDLQLVESLNDEDSWIQALKGMIERKSLALV